MTDDTFEAAQRRYAQALDEEVLQRVQADTEPDPPFTLHTSTKIPVGLVIPTEHALAYGFITEDEARANGWTPPPPLTRRQRIRRRWWTLTWWWHMHRPHLHLGPCPDQEYDT